MKPSSTSDAAMMMKSSTRRKAGDDFRCIRSTDTMEPSRNAAGMPRNTIQIREKRTSTSLHSEGCSSTKRITTWIMPSTEAISSMMPAMPSDTRFRPCSNLRKADFMLLSLREVAHDERRPAWGGLKHYL